MSRITDILTDVWNNGSLHGDTDKFMGTEAAEQALLALFDEAIGEDEPEYNPAPWSAGTHELELKYQVRRELRAEIRKKVGL